jgi:hypothetical protein
MKKSHLVGALSAVAFSFVSMSSHAALVVVDYEGVPGDPSSFFNDNPGTANDSYFPPGNNSWDEDGFRTSAGDQSILFGASGSDAYSQASDSVAVRTNGVTTINIFQINGGAFGAFAIDLSENCLAVCGSTQGVITGTKAGGGTVSMSYTLDDILGSQTFDLLGFNSEFGNITNLSWTTAGLGLRTQLDNISLSTSPVPLPAAVWFFGSGLLGLVGIARRKKTA